MDYECIVITGTSLAGKSSIANRICEKDDSFKIVQAVTTRKKRSDDTTGQYNYVSKIFFESLLIANKLLIHATYRNHDYGITYEAYNKVKNSDKIPLLVIAPQSKIEISHKEFFSFFVDVPDDILEKRSQLRESGRAEVDWDQIKNDRKEIDRWRYKINNLDLEKSVALIILMWQNRNQSGVLSKQFIKSMIACDLLLKNVKDETNIKGASYDLTLGDEYYSKGEKEELTKKNPVLKIDPYDYAIVVSAENANLPIDVVGRFGLSVSLFCQGVVLSNGPQVDPGFRGKLLCLLFNTSNAPVVLKRGEHYATIEFNKILGQSLPEDGYKGKYQDKLDIIHYLPSNTLRGAVSELKEELERVKAESHNLNTIIMGVMSVLLAIVAIILTLR